VWRHFRVWRLPLAVAIGLVAASAQAAPLATYGRLPSVERVAISPDGQLIAIAATDGEKRVVAIQRASDLKTVQVFAAGDSKVRDVTWAGPNHLLVTVSSTLDAPIDLIAPRQEWYFGVDIDVRTGKHQPLLHGVPDSLNTLAAFPTPRIIGGKPYAFVVGTHFVANMGHLALFKVDLESGRASLLADRSEHTVDWLVDAKGKPLAEAEFDAGHSRWSLFVDNGDHWRLAKTMDTDIGYPTLLGLGRDGRAILLSDSSGDDWALRELEPDAKDWGEPFAVQQDEDLIFAPSAGALIGAHALVGDADRYTFYAPLDQAFWNAAAKAYPDQRVTLESVSDDRKRIIVQVDSPELGPAYALVDLDSRQARWIGAEYDGLTPDDVSPVQPVRFKAADGLALSGYLTLPQGKPAKGLPLIVFPHGGPAARDEPGFDWWAQAMASRGYAVLQVNYRGSDGFGWDFLKAGFGEWGKKMQTDLSDGVRYLAAQGTIDPKRVCIVGASYGGYAALAGVTLDPGVYRCAVDVSGISDMRRFVLWSKQQTDISSQRYWDRFVGAKGPDDPRLGAISPALHAATVSAPVLIIHGKDDTVVPFEQSQMMADALKKADKPYAFVVLSHEDHWLSRGDTRLQMLKATMDFVEKNNPP
jgi:dipeptidyl aminopeptidase/acylaminoacyl peptidase